MHLCTQRHIPYSNRGRKTKKKNTKNKKRKIIIIHFARQINNFITFTNTSNMNMNLFIFKIAPDACSYYWRIINRKANYCTTRFKYEECFCELYLYYWGICFVMWYALALISLTQALTEAVSISECNDCPTGCAAFSRAPALISTASQCFQIRYPLLVR